LVTDLWGMCCRWHFLMHVSWVVATLLWISLVSKGSLARQKDIHTMRALCDLCNLIGCWKIAARFLSLNMPTPQTTHTNTQTHILHTHTLHTHILTIAKELTTSQRQTTCGNGPAKLYPHVCVAFAPQCWSSSSSTDATAATTSTTTTTTKAASGVSNRGNNWGRHR